MSHRIVLIHAGSVHRVLGSLQCTSLTCLMDMRHAVKCCWNGTDDQEPTRWGSCMDVWDCGRRSYVLWNVAIPSWPLFLVWYSEVLHSRGTEEQHFDHTPLKSDSLFSYYTIFLLLCTVTGFVCFAYRSWTNVSGVYSGKAGVKDKEVSFLSLFSCLYFLIFACKLRLICLKIDSL